MSWFTLSCIIIILGGCCCCWKLHRDVWLSTVKLKIIFVRKINRDSRLLVVERSTPVSHLAATILYLVSQTIWRLPWSQRLSFNIIFFHLEICGAKHWSRRRVGRKRKPLVATVANLTFMLAQHLTAVKDVIFSWPITKGNWIYNLLTGPGGSVLQYLEINYFVGRGEERLPCLQAAELPGSCFHS